MPTLNWIGKEAVVNHHQRVPFHLLKDVPDLACGDPGSGNLIVQGDNLVALKALLPYYAGQVKCIYIDPPYNTGNEGWTYNDNVNSPVIRKWLGEVVGKEGETLDRHDRWLCMMYPRLQLLRRFLRDDGMIFVNIGTDEAGHLCLLLDEVFGSSNRVAIAAWETAYTANQTAKHISETTDFVFIYAKNFGQATIGRFARNEDQLAKFKNSDGDQYGPWKAENLSAGKFYAAGQFTIVGPTGLKFTPPPGRYWRCNEAQFKAWLADGRITFGKGGAGRPMLKKYRDEIKRGLTPTTWWKHEEFATAKDGSLEVKALFGGQSAFATPKPTKLVERILQIATNPGDLILDSFAGSGTTGHAVLKLNSANAVPATQEAVGSPSGFGLRQPSGAFSSPDQPAAPEQRQGTAALQDAVAPNQPPPRRFILVEMEPKIARDITAERVRRVAEGYTNAKGERVAGLGGGFRFCELGEPLFDEHGKIRSAVRFADLARHVYFTETGEPLPEPVGAPVSNRPGGGGAAGEKMAGWKPALQFPDRLTAKPEGKQSRSLLTSAPTRLGKTPLLGVTSTGVAVYLLYNGILQDKSVDGGNVLTRATLALLPPHHGPKVVYAAGCRFSRERLKRENIVFKQTPYAIRIT